MGNVWSRSEAEPKTHVVTITTVVKEEATVKLGVKRSVDDNDVKSESLDSPAKKSKRKDGWAKKAKNNKKEQKGEKQTKSLQERPEHLGPREPRIPKKKVALLVGFNGTGYQGMQL
jgi:tRNA pseudouridine38-40 synthase